MVKLTIRDLIGLVASGVPNPETRLEKVYEWSHARHLELVKWVLAAAAALFVPIVIAFVRSELGATVPTRLVIATLFGSVALACLGIALLLRAGQAYRTYLAAQALLGEIRKVGPFLDRYRQELERR